MNGRRTDEKLAARIWERKRYSEGERGKGEGDVCIKREKENAGSAGQGGERKAKGSENGEEAEWGEGDGRRAEVDCELLAHK